MSLITLPPLASVFAIALLAMAPLASAQVTLNLTTAQQTNCTATTDAHGLQLAPGGADLQATGVTLSGSGCGGVPASNFQAAITVPGATVAGTLFNIQWSASATATQCAYGGATTATWTGVTGWPIGATACSGGSCAGSHLASVSVPTAGSYTFDVTCTNNTGYSSASTTSTAPPLPPQPNNFPLTIAPPSPTAGTPFQVSWAVTGATACSGTASLNNNSVSLPGWTNSVSATSPRAVTAAAAGTYVLGLTCTNAAPGQATSQSSTVVVITTGDNCPAGRQLTGDLCYNYNLAAGNCAVGADLTTFSSIWGRTTPTATPVPFPGAQYFTIFKNFVANQYVAAKFTVPATLPLTQIGLFTHGETLPGPSLTMAISPTCGDFNPSPSICLRSDIDAGGLLTKWQLPNAGGVACPLVPGQTYFVNVKMTRPTDCAGSSCTVTVQHNHTP